MGGEVLKKAQEIDIITCDIPGLSVVNVVECF